MASFVLKSTFCFLVAVFCFIDHSVEAREGKLFFSKFTHFNRPNTKEVALTPAPAPGLAETNGRLGDGPFGPGSGMVPQTKESWPVSSPTTDKEFEKLMATFDEEKKKNNLPEEFEEEEESEDSEDLNGQKDKYNNNNNGYTYTTNSNYNDNRRGYGNEKERQGMSDTRFMENGKYFYDTRARNSENTHSRGYERKDHSNEFETMEEYYKSLEGTQEEYEP
uniref:Protein E6 n=1 Tax=Noccaea caerulescens TaxID=107243 RepID=A0A1J3JXV9_NOCCA